MRHPPSLPSHLTEHNSKRQLHPGSALRAIVSLFVFLVPSFSPNGELNIIVHNLFEQAITELRGGLQMCTRLPELQTWCQIY